VHVLAQASWSSPHLDLHALAPELVLVTTVVAVLLLDLFLDERRKWITSSVAGFGLLASFVPVITFALNRDSSSMFGGAYVVDDFALVLKALFLLSGYVVILMSSTYIDEGDYYEGEYYTLLLSSILGMVMMASSRDLISIFIALEFLSVPAYMLAAWRKRDTRSNEAGVKYYLLGVFSSGVMLYGMSLLYGQANSTVLTDIAASVGKSGSTPIVVLAVVFMIVGFAFKVSAVPFHTWAPDTYEGAPTPVTAFLSVASKAAGFVALMELVFVAFPTASAIWQPFFWTMAALSMTVGNVLALRQTNIVRMLAYSSIAQGGFILMPLAAAGDAGKDALTGVITYLLAYAAMNLGAFAVVMVLARKTRRGDIASFGGLISYAPGLATLMTIFLASLGGVPPTAGFVAKLTAFRALLSAHGPGATVLALIGAVNSVIAFGYYGRVMREMWMNEVPDGDTTPVRVPQPLAVALAITVAATMLMGVLPQVILRFGDLGNFVGAVGK
jgi:NADH-quinone oxidoreductase subunit N